MNPTQQQQFQQNWMNAFNAGIQQPVAQLQETQAAAGAAGASAQESIESAQNTALQIQQKQLFSQFGDQLNKATDSKTGYVPPEVYNDVKKQAVGAGAGITSDQFDNSFEHTYADPANIQYNTSSGYANRNAYGEIKRQIQAAVDQYKSIPDGQKGIISSSALPGVFAQMLAPEAAAYENSTAGFAGQFKGLTGATRVTDAELSRWQNLLPSPRNNEAQNAKNLQVLDSQIKATFNTDKGLDPQYIPQSQQGGGVQTNAKGGDILTNALNDVANIGKSTTNFAVNQAENTLNPLSTLANSDPTGILGDYLQSKGLIPETNSQQATQQLQGMGSEALHAVGLVNKNGQLAQNTQDISSNVVEHAKEHPINTVADVAAIVAPFLGIAKGSGGETPATGSEDAVTAPNEPNAFSNFINPKGTIKAAADLRDTVVNAAQKAGKTIPGDNIVSDIEKWAEDAKGGNLGQGQYIDQAVTDAKKAYGGKDITPQQAAQRYGEADSGYTRNGVQKTPIQANIDRGLRDILANRLEEVAPGWQKSTELFSRGFQTQKNPARTMAKKVAVGGASTGLGLLGLDEFRKIIGL